MPTTATLVSTVIADAAVRVELLDTYNGVTAPTNVLNPISTITATVDGVSATVNVTSLAGGSKGFAIPFMFKFGCAHSVVITVTTADANPNPFTRTFTVRLEDSGSERDEVFVAAPGVGIERADVRVLSPLGGFIERVELYSVFTNNAFVDEVDVSVIPGLTAGYFTVERVELIVGRFEVCDVAYALTYDVGNYDEAGYPLTEEIQGTEYAGLSISEDVIATETAIGYPLTLESGFIEEASLPLTEDIGTPDQAGYPLTVDGRLSLLADIDCRAELRNEERAAAEDL